MGVAPTAPGIPDRASTPTQPEATARATRSSQFSPAATVTRTPPQVASYPSVSGTTPRVATLTTVPAKPSSATTRLLPPASTRSGSPAESAADTAAISSSSVVAVTKEVAGPPRCSVVWRARRSGPHDGLGHAGHLLAAAGDLQRDRGQPVGDVLDGAGHLDLDAIIVVRDHDRVAELAAQLDDLAAVGPARNGASGERHREHAVGDDARQPDGGRDPVGPVDRVEVAAGAGVADQVGAAYGVALRRQLGAGLEGAHASAPRWTRVALVAHTRAPSASVIRLVVPMMSLPPIWRRLATVSVAESTSPGTTARS